MISEMYEDGANLLSQQKKCSIGTALLQVKCLLFCLDKKKGSHMYDGHIAIDFRYK